jgi:integrase
VKGERLEALYLLAVTLGLRRRELLALKWDAIDFENRTVQVRASLQRVNGSLQLSETKTKAIRVSYRFLISSPKHYVFITRARARNAHRRFRLAVYGVRVHYADWYTARSGESPSRF